MRVVGDGRSDQPDAAPPVQSLPRLLDYPVRRAEAHWREGGADQAEAAAPRTAPLRLDEEQVAELCVRCEYH